MDKAYKNTITTVNVFGKKAKEFREKKEIVKLKIILLIV
jgi:hypothetical protein